MMHHDGLRVNALAPADEAAMDVYRLSGWERGEHADTDPDDPATGVRRVLPPAKPAPKTPKPKD
jgi:hypothetical protein